MRHKIVTKKKNPFYAPILAVLLLLILTWAIVVAVRATTKYRGVVALRNQVHEEFEELEAKEASLDEKIERLSTDDGVNDEIKSRYRVVEPHEQIVIIVPKEDAEENLPVKVSPLAKLRDFIGL